MTNVRSEAIQHIVLKQTSVIHKSYLAKVKLSICNFTLRSLLLTIFHVAFSKPTKVDSCEVLSNSSKYPDLTPGPVQVVFHEPFYQLVFRLDYIAFKTSVTLSMNNLITVFLAYLDPKEAKEIKSSLSDIETMQKRGNLLTITLSRNLFFLQEFMKTLSTKVAIYDLCCNLLTTRDELKTFTNSIAVRNFFYEPISICQVVYIKLRLLIDYGIERKPFFLFLNPDLSRLRLTLQSNLPLGFPG